ncbi:MAG: WD40 repeat domain-containing serine/threonine protein kinase [Zavarzinella sp.]
MNSLNNTDFNLEEIVRSQAEGFQEGRGKYVESFVAEHPALESASDLMIELIIREKNLRRLTGESPGDEEYFHRFPLLKDQLTIAFSLERLWQEQSLAESANNFSTNINQGKTLSQDSQGDLPTIPGYHIHSVVGRGAMSVVYRATQKEPHRDVALKVFHRLGSSHEVALDRFKKEANSLARLRDDRIVCIYAVGETDARPYLALEFLPAGSLANYLDHHSPTLRESVSIVIEVCKALEVAHNAKIIHRDLKPANILLDTPTSDVGTRVKVTDFGLAKDFEETAITQSGEILGTPAYMSPEQATGNETIDIRTDIFSIGVILYEMITGNRTFVGTTPIEIIRQVIDCQFNAPVYLNSAITKDLNTICLKCLERNRIHRYQTCDELRRDLEAYLENRPISARPITKFDQTWRWCKRNKLVSTLIFGIILTCIFGTLISASYAVRYEHKATAEMKSRISLAESQVTIKNQLSEIQAEQQLSQQRADENSHLLYNSNMLLTQNAWRNQNLSQMTQILSSHLPRVGYKDNRDFEWYHWCHTTAKPRIIHSNARFAQVKANQAGTSFLTFDANKSELAVYDATTHQITWQTTHKPTPRGYQEFSLGNTARKMILRDTQSIHIFNLEKNHHPKPITIKERLSLTTNLCINPTEDQFAFLISTGSGNNPLITVKVYSTVGELVTTFQVKGSGKVQTLAFSADGSYLILKAGATVAVYDLQKKTVINNSTIPDSLELMLAVHPIENRVALGSKDNIQFLRLPDLQLLHEVTLKDNKLFSFLPSGKQLFVMPAIKDFLATDDSLNIGQRFEIGMPYIWDIETHRVIRYLPKATIESQFLASKAMLRTLLQGIELIPTTHPQYSDFTNNLPEDGLLSNYCTGAISTDGKEIVHVSGKDRHLEFSFRTTADNSLVKTLDIKPQHRMQGITRIQYSRGRQFLAVTYFTFGEDMVLRPHVRVYDLSKPEPDFYELDGSGFELLMNDQVILLQDNKLLKWFDLSSRKVLLSIDGHSPHVAPGGKTIAFLKMTRLNDMQHRKECVFLDQSSMNVLSTHLLAVTPYPDFASPVPNTWGTWSPDGTRFVCAIRESTRRPDRMEEYSIYFFDRSGELHQKIPHLTRVPPIFAFSNDGSQYAIVPSVGTIKVRNTADHIDLYECKVPTKSILDVRFSPTDSRLIATTVDGKIILWDTKTQQEVLELDHPRVIKTWMPPDRSYIFSESDRGSYRIWHTRKNIQ